MSPGGPQTPLNSIFDIQSFDADQVASLFGSLETMADMRMDLAAQYIAPFVKERSRPLGSVLDFMNGLEVFPSQSLYDTFKPPTEGPPNPPSLSSPVKLPQEDPLSEFVASSLNEAPIFNPLLLGMIGPMDAILQHIHLQGSETKLKAEDLGNIAHLSPHFAPDRTQTFKNVVSALNIPGDTDFSTLSAAMPLLGIDSGDDIWSLLSQEILADTNLLPPRPDSFSLWASATCYNVECSCSVPDGIQDSRVPQRPLECMMCLTDCMLVLKKWRILSTVLASFPLSASDNRTGTYQMQLPTAPNGPKQPQPPATLPIVTPSNETSTAS